jgi:hypothetical protein
MCARTPSHRATQHESLKTVRPLVQVSESTRAVSAFRLNSAPTGPDPTKHATQTGALHTMEGPDKARSTGSHYPTRTPGQPEPRRRVVLSCAGCQRIGRSSISSILWASQPMASMSGPHFAQPSAHIKCLSALVRPVLISTVLYANTTYSTRH